MTTSDLTCRRPVRRDLVVPILGRMTIPPHWLRKRRRTVRAAARPGSPAAGTEPGRRRPAELEIKPIDWDSFGDRTMSDGEWEVFISAIQEAKGRPLVG